MANKSVTFTAPVSNDVMFIQITLDGAGVITDLLGHVMAQSNTASIPDEGIESRLDVGSLTASIATGVTQMCSELATQASTDGGYDA